MATKKQKPKKFDASILLDGFFVDEESEFAKYSTALHSFVTENDEGRYGSYFSKKLPEFKGGKELTSGAKEQLADLAGTLVHHMNRVDLLLKTYRSKIDEIWGTRSVLFVALRDVLRKKLPLGKDHVIQIAEWISAAANVNTHVLPLSGLIKAIENVHQETPLDGEARTAVEKMLANMKREWDQKPLRKFVERLENILGTAPEIPLEAGEAWSDAALADLAALSDSKVGAWVEILKHCQSATQGKPSKKWLKTAESLMDAIGQAPFCERMLSWFPLVDKPRTEEMESSSEWEPNPNMMINDLHSDTLKGLIWCSSLLENTEIARALAALAMSAYRKVPGVGPRAVKVGNACVYALGVTPGMDGVGQLAILKVRVKFRTAQKGIEKALVATAERVGIARDELEEMSVPSYGLTSVGSRTESFEEFTANLQVTRNKPELQWFRPDGKQQKSIPAVVKNDFAEELKELKQTARDIKKMVPAQVARIEQTYLLQKDWSWATWVERYLEHPLVGTITRRLIWSFQRGETHTSAIWTADGFVDSRNKSVDWPDPNTTVRLWHPLEENDTQQVTAWRDWLLDHEVQQPFKQAHREVYLLTDAERNTEVYSNRFAAHVLKQHQFNALCGARGWKNTLRLMVDDEFPPAHVLLPTWGLRAEFWVEGAGEEYGTDTNDVGTFYYLTTDQVRFYRDDSATNWAHASGGGYRSSGIDSDENDPVPLAEIPPLAFSEVMRDVDLFVGVASVGNDPSWNDGGPEGRYHDYWQTFSFGELGATAATRKSVLERLVPRLKIADRCSFQERFLVVRGDIRTYRIHLGSGNILMEPNDEYLCIVPKQAVANKSEGLMLPFEGDGTMSIILSKALLLADDTKIKDETIICQIKR